MDLHDDMWFVIRRHYATMPHSTHRGHHSDLHHHHPSKALPCWASMSSPMSSIASQPGDVGLHQYRAQHWSIGPSMIFAVTHDSMTIKCVWSRKFMEVSGVLRWTYTSSRINHLPSAVTVDPTCLVWRRPLCCFDPWRCGLFSCWARCLFGLFGLFGMVMYGLWVPQ